MRALYKRTKGKASNVQDRLYHKNVFCISNRWIRWAKRYLSKANRRADVQIMLWQLCCIFNVGGQMTEWITKKIERLNKRIEAAETGGKEND